MHFLKCSGSNAHKSTVAVAGGVLCKFMVSAGCLSLCRSLISSLRSYYPIPTSSSGPPAPCLHLAPGISLWFRAQKKEMRFLPHFQPRTNSGNLAASVLSDSEGQHKDSVGSSSMDTGGATVSSSRETEGSATHCGH